MASISSAGIGSGLDVNSIITKLMAVEQAPLTRLRTAAAVIDTRISAFGQIKSQLSALSDVATRLASKTAWEAKAASSSNADAVTASVSDASLASPTSFSIEVQQLAKPQSVASAAIATGGSTGTGQLTIQFGKWSAGSFAADAGSTALTIDIGTGEDSVAAVAAKINAAQAGVVATVVSDTSGQRLLLRSKSTGEAAGFRVQAQDDDGVNTDDAGLSRLAFDPEAGTFGMGATAQAAITQYGQNAKATINGIPVGSESNTLAGAVPGLDLTLAKLTTAAAEVKVSVDETAITKLANDFVSAYNSANQLLNQLTAYHAENKQGALLQGDATTLSLQNALRRLLGTRSETGSLATLSDVGIGVVRDGDGNVALNSSKFSAALKKPADLQTLFAADTEDAATDGFGRKLSSLMDSLLGTGGAVASKTDSLASQKKNNVMDQDRFNLRLSATEARLRKQYTSLDTQMAQFTALNTYITQQVAQWNKSTR